MRPVAVLDTSVLIGDPESLFAFPGHDLVIPLVVVEELDGHKRRMDEVGRAARQVVRSLEAIRLAGGGTLSEPVDLGNGARLQIVVNGLALDSVRAAGLDPTKPDNRIVAAALGLRERCPDRPVTVVAQDITLRIKAAQVGLDAVEYVPRLLEAREAGTGWYELDAPGELIDRLYGASPDGLAETELAPAERDVTKVIGTNEFAVVRNGSQSALVRRKRGALHALRGGDLEAYGIRPRSREQDFAMRLLLDPDVPLVALDGRAGTGKTYLALAAALSQVIDRPPVECHYERIAVFRPILPVGNQALGFLPGDVAEKLEPWMAAIHDALRALHAGDQTPAAYRDRLAGSLLDQIGDRLELSAVTYLRGRSLANTFIIVDEAQNLELSVVKTIVTRLARGSKIVLIGDTEQIDSPYLSERTNGLTALIEAFTGQEVFGHIRLTRCERSVVAELAAALL